MKKFTDYITEDKFKTKLNKTPSIVDKTRERQQREKEQLKAQQNREVERAREADFRKKESEKKTKEKAKEIQKLQKEEETPTSDMLDFGEDASEIYEYLEDGTIALVKAYKKELPGQ